VPEEKTDSTDYSDVEVQPLFNAHDEVVEIAVSMSVDKLMLFADVEILDPDRLSAVTKTSLRALLGEDFECPTLSDEALGEIVRSLNADEPVEKKLIAQGTPAEDGKHGEIRFIVPKIDEEYRHGKPVDALSDFGGELTFAQAARPSVKPLIDTSFLRDVKNLEPGNPVAEIIPETKAVNGQDVFGKEIKAKDGKPVKFKFDDKTLEIVEEKRKKLLVSKAKGFFTDERERLFVCDHLVIPGDVDMTTEDIDFTGKVSVRGDVVRGHSVTAHGDLEVDGNFYGNALLSVEGSVKVTGYVSGSRRTRIVAATDIFLDVVHTVNLEAGGSIYVNTEARDCVMLTSGGVFMPTGHIFGGEVHCRKGVEARQIGPSGGSAMSITLMGESHLDEAYTELSGKIREHERLEHKFRDRLGAVADYSFERLQQEKAELDTLYASAIQYQQLRKSLSDLKGQLNDLINQKTKGVVFRVSFKENFYKGVVVTAVDKRFKVDTVIEGPRTIQFTGASKRFRLVDYSELSQEVEEESEGAADDSNDLNGAPRAEVSSESIAGEPPAEDDNPIPPTSIE